jgi:hypothetical protein
MADNILGYEARLRRWPYAVRQLFQALKAELIEGHAVALACRALNIGRVTGFVGSSASMAYGRISWNDLVYVAQTAVLQRYEQHVGRLKARAQHHAQLTRIIRLLRRHRVTRSGPQTAVQQLTILQLAEEATR